MMGRRTVNQIARLNPFPEPFPLTHSQYYWHSPLYLEMNDCFSIEEDRSAVKE